MRWLRARISSLIDPLGEEGGAGVGERGRCVRNRDLHRIYAAAASDFMPPRHARPLQSDAIRGDAESTPKAYTPARLTAGWLSER